MALIELTRSGWEAARSCNPAVGFHIEEFPLIGKLRYKLPLSVAYGFIPLMFPVDRSTSARLAAEDWQKTFASKSRDRPGRDLLGIGHSRKFKEGLRQITPQVQLSLDIKSVFLPEPQSRVQTLLYSADPLFAATIGLIQPIQASPIPFEPHIRRAWFRYQLRFCGALRCPPDNDAENNQSSRRGCGSTPRACSRPDL
jgi:hypothetical protein